MFQLANSLRDDERGFIVSSELVLVATVGVIGIIAGLSAVSCAVVDELNDVAGAFSSMNQSFRAPSFTGTGFGSCGFRIKSFVAGSVFTDVRARQTVVSSATMVGGPVFESSPIPMTVPALPQPAPCEAPVVTAPTSPPSEIKQPTCVMCYVCCPACPIEAVCPPTGQPVPSVIPGSPGPGFPTPQSGARPNPEPTPVVIPKPAG